ncbi:hypothetical protein DNTS_021952 [Danionella cerebrum]|uniref:Microtubule-associated tumor suppressor candidate 2 n=1 Tax=Danionella cerebrum TaxID=2873325 RepID=A0A553QMC4_9TELE|nr:hypothetical protein DNTS_021952 [Danionella translucida]
MSINDEHPRSFGTPSEDGCGEILNNNGHVVDSLDGDTNANEIQRGDRGTTLEMICTTSSIISCSEGKVQITTKNTDSPCEDLELVEFEMLESQGLDNDEENESKKVPSTNMMQTEAKPCNGFTSKEHGSSIFPQPTGAEEGTTITKAELSSENDAFVTCLSTVSSFGGSLGSTLDHIGQIKSSDSCHAPSMPHRTLSEDLTFPSLSCHTISDRNQTEGMYQPGNCTSADHNHNSTTSSLLEAQSEPGPNFSPCKSLDYLSNNISAMITAPEESGSIDDLGGLKSPAKEENIHENRSQNLRTNSTEGKPPVSGTKQATSHTRTFSHDAIDNLKNKLKSQEEDSPECYLKISKPASNGTHIQGVGFEPQPYQKQASFEKIRCSSLERRRPWVSPSRSEIPSSPKSSPRKQTPSSPAKLSSTRESTHESLPRSGLRQPSKSFLSSNLQKLQSPTRISESKSSPPQNIKNTRSKIITYVRRNPQARAASEGPYEVSTLPPRVTSFGCPPNSEELKDEEPRGSPVLTCSNILFDKYRQEVQRTGYHSPPGRMVSGIRPPGQTTPQKLVGKSDSFHGELPGQFIHEHGRMIQPNTHDGSISLRFSKALRPQLGLRGITRQPAKNRTLSPSQRSAAPLTYTSPAVAVPSSQQEPTDHKKLALGVTPKLMLPKVGQSGIRPPGFSHLPPARLAAFGFVRSASVSSVSSNQSSNSTQSDPCRPNRPHSSSDETLLSRSPHSGSPTHRHLTTPPHTSPSASRKEFQRDGEIRRPIVSSPKRFAVVCPKPMSPVRQKSCVARLGGRSEGLDAEREGLMLQSLKERCEDQARQLSSLQDELRKSFRCLDVFTITTQHFCQKSETAVVKERELALQLARIRDEVVVSVQRWEHLQGEKAQLEQKFERQLKRLHEEQQQELKALQERLLKEHSSEIHILQEEQSNHLVLLRSQQQEQIEKMGESHETAMMEMEAAHSATLATLQEEHNRTTKNLKMAHEQQQKSMEEEFEKLRLSLQDQVDTLTFQNRALRDRAKRFEEALRRSTDEQIVDALAPYQHIEEDLKSLKEVLEMKNQQIHQQELKITELEKMAQKNVLLEERIQVLQQQNEDLKDRIDRNLAASRQLSEENANLHTYVEKESNEKKRLSRTNEELLWRLQTGELSPRMSPTQSPLHRPSSSPTSPSRQQTFPR